MERAGNLRALFCLQIHPNPMHTPHFELAIATAWLACATADPARPRQADCHSAWLTAGSGRTAPSRSHVGRGYAVLTIRSARRLEPEYFFSGSARTFGGGRYRIVRHNCANVAMRASLRPSAQYRSKRTMLEHNCTARTGTPGASAPCLVRVLTGCSQVWVVHRRVAAQELYRRAAVRCRCRASTAIALSCSALLR